ncbi:serine hydrolase domain-containing protein [Kitasatospora sp. NPDC096147]|uniref:serine hydrolase domain-containing protein n=1 Tax=Kitasatospora sp. NPDC096147 TaxID=3364093 RepID=UPI003805BF2E
MTVDGAGIRRLLADGVGERMFPGAVWAVGDVGGLRVGGTAGVLDPERPGEAMREDTVFDLASLTKILAVWSVVGTLWEEGRIELDRPLGASWPEVAGAPLGEVTARQLLTHTAGLPLHARLRVSYGTDPVAIRAGVLRERLHRPPGEAVDYTDRAALILGYLAEYLTGQTLDVLAVDRIWRPLGMRETWFGPLPEAVAARCAPTEWDEEAGLRWKGVVHDPSARLLGGVAGIAGVFSVAEDLGLFLRHLLAPSARPTGFGAAWTAESLRVWTGGLEPARGLFWYPAPGTGEAEDVWVHYGFTGTGMWVSPRLGRWAVLLTNKVYVTRDREPMTTVRNRFRELAFA